MTVSKNHLAQLQSIISSLYRIPARVLTQLIARFLYFAGHKTLKPEFGSCNTKLCCLLYLPTFDCACQILTGTGCTMQQWFLPAFSACQPQIVSSSFSLHVRHHQDSSLYSANWQYPEKYMKHSECLLLDKHLYPINIYWKFLDIKEQHKQVLYFFII